MYNHAGTQRSDARRPPAYLDRGGVHGWKRAGGRGVCSEADPALLVQRRRVRGPHSLARNRSWKRRQRSLHKKKQRIYHSATRKEQKKITWHLLCCPFCKCQRTPVKYSNQEAEQRKAVCCGPTPDHVVTCLWLSELCPRHSSCCDHRLPVCIAPAVLPLVLPPRVRGCGGGLVRGDHWGCWFRLVRQINTVMGGGIKI